VHEDEKNHSVPSKNALGHRPPENKRWAQSISQKKQDVGKARRKFPVKLSRKGGEFIPGEVD